MQNSKILKLLIAVLMMALSLSLVSAQDTTPSAPAPAPSGEISIGETIDVQTPASYTLAVEEIIPVTIIARSLDGQTSPSFSLLNPSGENIFTVEVNATYRNDMGPKDVGIQNMMLTQGNYTLQLSNAANEDTGAVAGDGRISLSVLEGTAGVLGAGPTEIVSGQITEEKPVYGREINLTEGEVITIAARVVSSALIGAAEGSPEAEDDAGLDTSMVLYAPDGQIIATNDDHDSDSLVLDFGDSQFARFIVPETGTYRVAVRDFEGTHTGEIWLIATRHGTLAPSDVEPEVYSGRILTGGRRTFIFEAVENEMVSVVAHATDAALDTVLTLYNPDGLPVIQNDDHSTTNPDLTQFDSVIENFMVITSGQYEIDLQTYDNGGSYEVTLTRWGVVQPTDNNTVIFGDEVDVPTPTAQP